MNNRPHSGAPSRAGYQKGCRCRDCTDINTAYLSAYRRKKVPLQGLGNGSPQYHTHKGAPSSTTARSWGCSHDECLRLAGLYLDIEGIVRLVANDMIDPVFGTVVPRKPPRRARKSAGQDA